MVSASVAYAKKRASVTPIYVRSLVLLYFLVHNPLLFNMLCRNGPIVFVQDGPGGIFSSVVCFGCKLDARLEVLL
jgi:hypothetical protein